MRFPIDGALYPDQPIPERLETMSDRIDFLARLCSAWDFGRLPDSATVSAIRQSDWQEAVEATRLLTSPAYHLLRRWHGLSEVPFLGQRNPVIVGDPCLDAI